MISIPTSPAMRARGDDAVAPRRVVVADAHPATRDVLLQILGREAGFRVVGVAATIEEAVRLTRETQPDILILDPWLSGAAGLPACLVAKQFRPGLALVALLPDDREEYRRAAEASGADVSLQKRQLAKELLPALAALSSR
jgi:DNA-binding NarL/FixJ family response regulator